MKNFLVAILALIILGVLSFVAYQRLYKSKTLPTPVVEVQKEDLNAQLETTVDDGGQADFDALTKDSSEL